MNKNKIQVLRKHWYRDTHYHLHIYADKFTLSVNINGSKPKYVQLFSQKVNFQWMTAGTQIIGFRLFYQSRFKEFFSTNQEMQLLKAHLGQKMIFSKFEEFYRFVEKISDGAFSKVSKYFDQTNSIVAVKEIEINQQNNFSFAVLNEIKILQHLQTMKNTIKLIEIFSDGNTYHIVTEFIDAQNLQQVIDKKVKPFRKSEVLDFAYSLLTDLQEIHKMRIIHRDLKPANIMYQKGKPKIIDFGLSCFFGYQQAHYAQCGTQGYTAPEVYRSKTLLYDHRVDIYSLGCILYQMATLKNWNGVKSEKSSLMDFIYLFLNEDPNERPDISELLEMCQSLQEFRHYRCLSDRSHILIQTVPIIKEPPAPLTHRQGSTKRI